MAEHIPRCDIGDHDVTDGSFLQRCAHCNRRVCFAHQGNPDDTAGSYVACQEHTAEVAEMNRAWLEGFRKHYAAESQVAE